MNEQWIHQMRQKMADYRQPAPKVSWDEIDRAVAAAKSRRNSLLWLRRLAAAAVLLLVAGVGYWSFQNNEVGQTIEKRMAQKQPMDHLREDDYSVSRGDDKTRLPKQESIASAGFKPETTFSTPTTDADTVNTIVTEDEAPSPSDGTRHIPPREQTPQKPVFHSSDLHQQQHIDNRLTAKVYMSSMMADSRQTESFDTRWEALNSVGKSWQAPQLHQYIHHHQPLRFGLSLRYRLNDRWSMESGLTYTHLSSDITTTANGVTTMTEQRLNYVGLPLNVSYNLWKSRRLGLYVTAGSMVEKCLDNSSWQLSLSGAAGVEYKLTNIFSLYAEPGIGYYFNNGSSTPTIYQDHPLNFNLSLGLRFNLK